MLKISNSFGHLRTISTTVDFAKDFHWLFIGGAGAVTPLHIDPTTTHAWLTQISGRKRFTLWAPSDIPELLSEDQNRSTEDLAQLFVVFSIINIIRT